MTPPNTTPRRVLCDDPNCERVFRRGNWTGQTFIRPHYVDEHPAPPSGETPEERAPSEYYEADCIRGGFHKLGCKCHVRAMRREDAERKPPLPSADATAGEPSEADFFEAVRIIGLIVTMPDREHTFVPTKDLKTLARVITDQASRLAAARSSAPTGCDRERWHSPPAAAPPRETGGDAPTLSAVPCPDGCVGWACAHVQRELTGWRRRALSAERDRVKNDEDNNRTIDNLALTCEQQHSELIAANTRLAALTTERDTALRDAERLREALAASVPRCVCHACQKSSPYHDMYRCFQCQCWFHERCMADHLAATHNVGGNRLEEVRRETEHAQAEVTKLLIDPPAAPRAPEDRT